MTAHWDGYEKEDEWNEGVMRPRECADCESFEHNYCECMESDHFAHMLLPMHPACKHFDEDYGR
jgi:hypothetical protein